MNPPTLTPAQQESLKRLADRGWNLDIAGMHYALGEGRDGCGCVMVHATTDTHNGSSIWFGIEIDGYAHS